MASASAASASASAASASSAAAAAGSGSASTASSGDSGAANASPSSGSGGSNGGQGSNGGGGGGNANGNGQSGGNSGGAQGGTGASGTSGSSTSASAGASPSGTVGTTGGTNSTNATTTATGDSSLSTQVPILDLSNTAVPFLLQRPVRNSDGRVSAQRYLRQTSDAYFQGCGVANNQFVSTNLRINISAVYSHFDVEGNGNTDPYKGNLKIVAVGAVDSEAYAVADGSTKISESRQSLAYTCAEQLTCVFSTGSLQTQSRFLTFDVPVENSLENLCDRMYPTAPDLVHNLTGPYRICTWGPGQVAFGVSIPLDGSYAFGSINTQLRISDSSTPARTISCIEVEVTPYYPNEWYWKLIFAVPVAMAAATFVLAAVARIVTAVTMRRQLYKNKARLGGAPTFVKDVLCPTIVSALAGDVVVRSPALLRFVTPGCVDIILFVQYVSILGMIAVQWPEFVYPVLKQASWGSLLGNVTLTQMNGIADRWDALHANAFLPQSSTDLANQMINNITSPVFIDQSTPNIFLNLNGTDTGLEAYARMVGLQASDVFGTTTGIWLLLIAALLAASLVIWLLDTLFGMASLARLDREDSGLEYEEKVTQKKSEGFLERYIGFHAAAFHGNVARLLVIFHLPLTIVSVYHFTAAREHLSGTVALAALSFTAFSVFAPAYFLYRIAQHSTEELYQNKRLLLLIGPIYNYYHPGSQLFAAVTFIHSLALGIVIGAAQVSGSAQSIVFLLLEVLLAVAYILWLPWGDGSFMSPISFTWSMLRVITAVLILLLAPVVNFSSQARGWLTWVILFIQAIVLLGIVLLFLAKLIETAIRLYGHVTFDDRTSSRHSGIPGALRRIRRRKYKTLQLKRGTRRRNNEQTVSVGSMNKLVLANSPASTPFGGSTLQSSAGTRYENAFGPYAAYLSPDAMDEGSIMSSMPSPYLAPHNQANPYNPTAGGSPPGFVRLGGGRATDEHPFRLPSAEEPKPNGAFGRDRHSPSQSLALATAVSEAERKKKSKRKPFFRRGPVSSGEDTSDDDLGGWTADGQPKPRKWAGMRKIRAAFSRRQETEEPPSEAGHTYVAEDDDGVEEPVSPGPTTGFSVIRPQRNSGAPLARGARLPQTSVPGARASLQPSGSSLLSSPKAPEDEEAAGRLMRGQRYAASDSSHGSVREDDAAKEERFWLDPEAAAARRSSQPHLLNVSTKTSAGPKQPAPVVPHSAADAYANGPPSAPQARASQNSLLSRYAEAQSAEILTLDEN